MNIQNTKYIYMIGIKGVGMTMLAQYFSAKGVEVLGSDAEETFMTDSVLKKNNIKVFEGFNIDNIPEKVDLIIYSSAYNSDTNIELKHVLETNAKIFSYAEALGEVFNSKYGIAVCGSHGKTTTSAWLGYVLDRAGVAPNVMVGANVPQFDGNILISESNYLVIEADEYQNKLKSFNPRACLLNNIDYDHPDFFRTEEAYSQVFIDFISRIPKKGFLVTNFDDEIIQKIANVNSVAKVVSYAIDNTDSDFVAYDIRQDDNKQYFKVSMYGDNLGEFSIALSGKHNIYNALAVIATCIEMDVELVSIREHLENFSGTARRMEVVGKCNGALIIDDYAHHPTEIRTTLQGIREMYEKENIICLFHPHTFTRTKGFFDGFVRSFADVEELIILDIYGSAREEQGGVHSTDIVKAIKKNNEEAGVVQKVDYIPTLIEAEEYLRKKIGRGDLVILMGAGDVFRVGENLVSDK